MTKLWHKYRWIPENILGSTLFALGFALFLAPNSINTGGISGLAMVLVIHPIFVWLAKNDHTIVITFLYVFTLMVVIAFAIEIGQRLTGTGAMEFADIVYGIAGFLAAFLVFVAARAIVRFIASAFFKGRRHKRR